MFTTLLVTGRRDWRDRAQVRKWIAAIGPSKIIVGDAKGADSLAVEFAGELGIETIVFAADWEASGRAAGPMRNQKMIDEGSPDGCLAFYDGCGRGTKDMIVRCKRAGIPVLIVWK